MLQDANAGKLSSIKTYLLIALIFNILAIVAFALVSLFLILTPLGIIVVGFVAVPLILDIVIFGKINRMRSAAESGDIATLKAQDSLGWAIVALFTCGIIPGILLLIAHGAIDELQTSVGGSTWSTPPPMAQASTSTDDSKFCAVCGTKMAKSAAFCPKCGAAQH